MTLYVKKWRAILLLTMSIVGATVAFADVLDNMVAIVEDDVILEKELEKEVDIIEQKINETHAQRPPMSILRRQVLERMIINKLQHQLAEKAGVNISDEMLTNSAMEIARRNNMNLDEFQQELEKQGMNYAEFLSNLKSEIVINELRGREIGGRIRVTDREVEHYLETQGKEANELVQYHLGHILISVPEGASATIIQKAQAKAQQLVEKLKAGQNFTETAMTESGDTHALKGGDLGWRTLRDMSTIFVSEVGQLKKGDISAPLRSPSGFHIIKMIDIRGQFENHTITRSKVRHILIKTNEIIDDAQASKRLLQIRERIANGDDFASLARAHSDDKGSAIKGGLLDWVEPGVLVKPFEQAMSKLAIGELSEPVQTPFGWHLIQVLERENKDDSLEYKKNQIKEAIRKRKIEEETELWLRKLRDEAYVEIFDSRL